MRVSQCSNGEQSRYPFNDIIPINGAGGSSNRHLASLPVRELYEDLVNSLGVQRGLQILQPKTIADLGPDSQISVTRPLGELPGSCSTKVSLKEGQQQCLPIDNTESGYGPQNALRTPRNQLSRLCQTSRKLVAKSKRVAN